MQVLKAWWALISGYGFVVQFLANLLSSLLVALGVSVYLIRQLHRGEEARLARENKVLLLRAIREELEDNRKEFERVRHHYENRTDYPFFVKLTLWEVLRPSGELPKLISFELLDAICEQYYRVRKVMEVEKRASYGLSEDTFADVLCTLKSALENHPKVIEAIDSALSSL
jgi:hypothetical protein